MFSMLSLLFLYRCHFYCFFVAVFVLSLLVPFLLHIVFCYCCHYCCMGGGGRGGRGWFYHQYRCQQNGCCYCYCCSYCICRCCIIALSFSWFFDFITFRFTLNFCNYLFGSVALFNFILQGIK